MRQETINIYRFEELSDEAKGKAREWYRNGNDYFWVSESMKSIETFCNQFNVKLVDYSIDPYAYSYIKTDVNQETFRGVKLSDVGREAMPTGYYMDNILFHTFYDTFKATGDAKGAFIEALAVAGKAIQDDMEYQNTDEYIDGTIIANEYEFTANGNIY